MPLIGSNSTKSSGFAAKLLHSRRGCCGARWGAWARGTEGRPGGSAALWATSTGAQMRTSAGTSHQARLTWGLEDQVFLSSWWTAVLYPEGGVSILESERNTTCSRTRDWWWVWKKVPNSGEDSNPREQSFYDWVPSSASGNSKKLTFSY